MLCSVDEVIEAVGGPAGAAALVGVGPSAVSNWRSRGEIPSENFLLFRDALAANGKEISPLVFGFKVPSEPA